ncbi:MAG: beta-hydroxyacyl-ACP dehydratase [Oxalobacter sp.]|nr:MAG: beta-hydroxyacyl-ACP dehydratase [Oxalobacter sp.]
MMNIPHTLPPIEALLPHRDTMLLLDRVVEYENDTVVAECTPRSDAWYADAEGQMPGWIGVELMAQAVAAHVGLSKRQSGLPVKQGVLLGTRRYTTHAPAFPADEPLRIKAVMIFIDESGLGAYACHIYSGESELASATLKVYEPENFDAFLKRELND